MFSIPTYDIVFWYYLKPETEKYKDKAIFLAEAFPYETTEYEGVQDIHWGTENESEAIAIFERLKKPASGCTVTHEPKQACRDCRPSGSCQLPRFADNFLLSSIQ